MRDINGFTFITDVDGVLSTGQFLYNAAQGKEYKIFGPDDALALQVLSRHCDVLCVSGDKRGWDITKKRCDDIHIPLQYAPSSGRLQWIKDRYALSNVMYMGDSFTDIRVAENVGISFCPRDAFIKLRSVVDHVCSHDGGRRAIAEAVFIIFERFGLDTSELID